MILKIYTEIDELPNDIDEFGRNPSSSFGYVSSDYFWEDNDRRHDKDDYISKEPTPRYSLPLNKIGEPMYFAWDDWDYCAVVQKADNEDSELPFRLVTPYGDIDRYDMPDGTVFYVLHH